MKYVAYITLLLALILIGYFAFNLLYPYNPIAIESPIPLDKSEYTHGDTIKANLVIDKYDEKAAKVSRQFVDTVLYTLPSYDSNMPKGKYNVWDSTTTVPEGLPYGDYYVLITLTYKYPPFREIGYTVRTESFKVVP